MSHNQNLKSISEKFGLLLRKESEGRDKSRDALLVLDAQADAIKEARSLKISYFKISTILNSLNIKATPRLVRDYCVTKLGDTPKAKKRKKRVRANSVNTPERKALKLSPAPMTPVERKKQEATSGGTSKQKSSKNGFRVADNDL
jgi:hypothetical protein